MTTHNQPINLMIGDRVIYEGGYATNLNGKTGTIAPHPYPEFSGSTTGIKFDDQNTICHCMTANLRREPIEIGSHVRYNIASSNAYIGEVNEIVDAGGDVTIYNVARVGYLSSNVVRVTEPVLQDQPPHEFMPGDRIYCTTGKSHATIYAVEKDKTIVDFDNNGVRSWTHESVRQFFRRQTIEVGCWVRIHGYAGNTQCIGDTFKVESIGPDLAYYTNDDKMTCSWSFKHLARIAEPIRHVIEAENFIVNFNLGTAELQSFQILPDIRQHHTGKLQQAWRNMGDGTIEWRDVPTMKAPKTFKRGQPVRYIATNAAKLDDITDRNGFVVNIMPSRIEAYEVFFPTLEHFKWCCADNLE